MTRPPTRKAKIEPYHVEESLALKKIFNERATLSQAAFGAEHGIGTQGMVWQYLNAGSPLNLKVATKFAKALGVEVRDFSPRLAAEAEELAKAAASDGGVASEIDLETHPDLVAVRKVIFKISAGIAGFSVEYLDNGEGTPFFYSRSWADKHRLVPDKLYAVRVSGCSMEPTLQNGDVVVIDTGNVKREKDAICAVNHEGEFTVKRLKYEHRRWWLVSDNNDKQSYPPRECTESTFIIGRVVRLERDF